MRCAECERLITNAEMWELCNNPHAPTSRSMQLLCWECRLAPPPAARSAIPVGVEDYAPRYDVVAQAVAVVRSYLARAN